MKRLTTTIALILAATAPLPVFAGRDQSQIVQQERAIAAKKAQMQAQGRQSGPAAAGPAGDAQAAKEGPPSRQIQLLKTFHPKHAYGY